MARAVCTACGQEFHWDHLAGVKLADIPSPCCGAKAKGKTTHRRAKHRIGIMCPYQKKWHANDEWRDVIGPSGKPVRTLFTPTDDGLIYSHATAYLRPVAPSVNGAYHVLTRHAEQGYPIYRIKESDFQVLEAIRNGVK